LKSMSGLLAAAGHLGAARDLDDAALLARFAAERDAAAFEVLVWRHGGMVRGVCRRYLRDPNDIDDATQAAFIALARKAKSVRAVGPWLARVAAHAAGRLRRANATRAARHNSSAPDRLAREASLDDGWRRVLAEEIDRLPDRYRVVVRRCYLDGLTAAEAALELGWVRATVLTRLAWAKARLRSRLIARGVALGSGVGGLLFQLAAGPVNRAAAREIVRVVVGAAGSQVSRLTDGVIAAMFWTRVKFVTGIALSCGAAIVCAAASKAVPFANGREVVAVAPQPRVSQPAVESEKSPQEAVPASPAKTKPGAGPGFGYGAVDTKAAISPAKTRPTPNAPLTPAKVKPGVGPGSGAGGESAPEGSGGPVRTKPGAVPGYGRGSGGE